VEGLDSNGATAVLSLDPETGVPGGVTPLTGDWGDTEFAPEWGPQCEAQCIGTELTAKAKRKARLKVSGAVVPGVAGSVKVTLVRATKRGWRTVDVSKVRSRAGGGYAASFARPSKGRCGVLVEFAGTKTHMPSYTAVPPFAC
jgi:hypothetical protein